ncbi:MAG: N-acetyl-gamma-glutamyl-phosphate reductase [Pseudomonadota bacterium]
MKKVFIDGEAGTTGLQIVDRLAALPGLVDVISIDHDKRKDASARQEMMAAADVIILCLPDDAAREAVALADALGDRAPKIIDASTAHRTTNGWVYGFPELTQGHAQRIAAADRVANVGCYATASIALIRPMIEAGLLPPTHPFSINAVSGYTGGGKAMIAAYEAGDGPLFQLYGLELAHKHVLEIIVHTGLERRPLFVPSVGNFPQGMLVSVPVDLSAVSTRPSLDDLDTAFQKHYGGPGSAVRFRFTPDANDIYESGRLPVDPAVNDDHMDIWLFANEAAGHALLVARLDNLGKGAAGAAIQNLKLMIGHSPDA